MRISFLRFAIVMLLAAGCVSRSAQTATEPRTDLQREVQGYLDKYNTEYQKLYKASSEAAWTLNTYIVPGDTVNSGIAQRADEAMAAYTGSRENIEKPRVYLAQKKKLLPLQVR